MQNRALNIAIIWALGLGIMLILYFAGNPFGVYDDIVIIAGLLFYSLIKKGYRGKE